MSYTDNWPQGQCTWRVALYYMIPWSGNARDWAAGAQAHGWQVSSVPSIGDIAVFQPGDNGALDDGHVAVVTNVNNNGTYTVWEQNVTFGTAAPDSRTVSLGTGTQFITPPVSARTDQFTNLFSDAAAVGGPASSQAQLAGLNANPFDLFGVPGTVVGGITGVVSSALHDVFVWTEKSFEVIIGVALLAFGSWVLVRQSEAGRGLTGSYVKVVKQGIKEAAVAA